MSEVKIYSCEPDLMSPQVEGEKWLCDFVLASDYAALEKKLTDQAVQLANAESKCRELAAENAGLKTAAKETLAHWAAAEDGEMELMMDKCMPALRDAYCETPATDSFLAEVRAQGVEMFAKNAEGAEQGNGLMKAIARRATKFAAQLRKGAAL